MPHISLEIDTRRQSSGWMDCQIVVDHRCFPLEASAVFPPFLDLLTFVRAIAWQRLPARCDWNPEGPYITFLAEHVADDLSLVRFKILSDEDSRPLVDVVIERAAIVQAFVPPVRAFAAQTRFAEVMWHTPLREVQRIEQEIATPISLRTDTHTPQPIEFSVEGHYRTGSIAGYVSLNASMHHQNIFHFHLHDTHPFWQAWTGLVNDVHLALFPSQCSHTLAIDMKSTIEPSIWTSETRLLAEAVEDPANFRLKVFYHCADDPEYLELDEVISRDQFVTGFIRAFDRFLSQHYRVIPNPQGITFDLRTLPLIRQERGE